MKKMQGQTVTESDVTSIIARSNVRRSKGRYRALFAALQRMLQHAMLKLHKLIGM